MLLRAPPPSPPARALRLKHILWLESGKRARESGPKKKKKIAVSSGVVCKTGQAIAHVQRFPCNLGFLVKHPPARGV